MSGAEKAVGLDVEVLSARRNGRRLFEGVTFGLRAGEILQVSGRNGSGKTTLLRILCGLVRPSSGSVLWCGRAVAGRWPEGAAEPIYIGHLGGVKEELTPLENLRFAAALTGVDVAPAQVLERVGLAPDTHAVPCSRLSAGQRRRVGLARLLLGDSRLWLLDEPFTALDQDGCALVEQLLGTHAAGGGLAVVSSHHELRLPGCRVRQLPLDR